MIVILMYTCQRLLEILTFWIIIHIPLRLQQNENQSKFSVGEGTINQLVTLDDLAYYNPSPSNSSSHTMDIHPEINETDEGNETHINVLTSLTTGSQSDRCVLDSGANRHIFMADSWLEGSHSSPITPTVANIHGISGLIPATKRCAIGHQVAFICPSDKDNVLSLGWMTQFPSIVTTFSNMDNAFRIKFWSKTFTVPMASDSLYYLSKSHVKLLLTHVNRLRLSPEQMFPPLLQESSSLE